MNIISQNLRNVLKKRLENTIKELTPTIVEVILDSLNNKDISYLEIIDNIDNITRNMAIQIIIETLEEYDRYYTNSKERKRKYNINKRNIPRTITTILGELTFKRTYFETKDKKEHYFHIDDVLKLPKWDHYDPIVKGLAIRETFYNNQAQAGRIIGERITRVSNITNKNTKTYSISRQTVNNWINDWNTVIVYDKKSKTPHTLYIMVDEKYIGSQGSDKDIMVKSFVVFEGIKQEGKGRRKLINRHVFNCKSSKPWEELLDRLEEIYNYEEIKNFYVLSDGGNWITAGISELRLESFQESEHLLCNFHFRQALNHITTVPEERKSIYNSFLHDKRRVFKNNLNKYIDKYPHKKDTINKMIKYILNHYQAAKRMVDSSIGSSMESHISHYVANIFSSRPKGYSEDKISKYLMLNDARINGINLFNAYLQTYNENQDEITEYQEIMNNTISGKKEEDLIYSLPYLENSSSNSALSKALKELCKTSNTIKSI